MNPFLWPGPQFLALYALGCALALALAGGLQRRGAGRRGEPAPALDGRDPYEIALLRGGPPEALRAAAFALLERSQLERTQSGLRSTGCGLAPAHPLEAAVLTQFGSEQPVRALFAPELQQVCRALRESLERDGLLLGEREHTDLRNYGVLIGSGLGAIAGVKIALALAAGHDNVLFLIALWAASTWGIQRLLRSARTPRGDAALRALQGRLREHPAPAQTSAAGSGELTLLVAALGCGALPTALYAWLPALFPHATGADGIGGSCSGSCGSAGCGGAGGCGGCGG